METCKASGIYGDVCRGVEYCSLFHEYIFLGETTIQLKAFVESECPVEAIEMVRERKERERLESETVTARIESLGE